MSVYPYIVKHNGVWYPAGANVPDEDIPIAELPFSDAKENSETAENTESVKAKDAASAENNSKTEEVVVEEKAKKGKKA